MPDGIAGSSSLIGLRPYSLHLRLFALVPPRNRSTVQKPVVIGFLAFRNRSAIIRAEHFENARSARICCVLNG
jgi:hypothetical protein